MTIHIGFLEDESFQIKVLETLFQQANYQYTCATDVATMCECLQTEQFDILLLDWLLPDGTAETVINFARKKLQLNIPILILSSQEDEGIVVKALEIGADDYITKPMRKKEMIARIQSHLRRYQPHKIASPDLPVAFNGQQLICNNDIIKLSDKEFVLVQYMIDNVGVLLSRSELMEHVWGITADLDTRTVDTHISRLRKKLEKNCANTLNIVGIHGHGYRMEFH